uniref:Uncharacterized protein n=1 Tax=Picocystis salinarum TaxID=88271 RepID=A0A7S3UCR4_9CHLO
MLVGTCFSSIGGLHRLSLWLRLHMFNLAWTCNRIHGPIGNGRSSSPCHTLAHHSSDASEQSRSLSLRTGWRRCGLRALDSGGRVRRWRRPRGRVRPGGRARSCWHTKVDTPTVWRFPLATSVEHVVRDATSDPERGRFVSSVSFVRSRIIACDAVGSVHGSIEHAGTTPLRFHSTTFSSVSHGSPLARILPSVSRTSIHPSLLLHDLHAPPERLRLITST